MKDFLRNALTLAAAASAAVSCLSSVKSDGGQEEITFHPVIGAEVRSEDITTFSEEESFSVWAMTPEGERFMDGKEVTFDGEKWSAAEPCYWPEATSLRFVACSPSGCGMTLEDDGRLVVEDFEPDRYLEGLYVSEPTEALTSEDGTVHLNFRKATSTVDFRVANGLNQVTFVKLEKIVLCGVRTKGNFDSSAEPQWSVSGELSDITVYDSSVYGIKDDVGRDPEFFGRAVDMIPQQSRPRVKVVYSFMNSDSEWLPGQENMTGELEARWEPGRHYTYTLTLTETIVKHSAGISTATD